MKYLKMTGVILFVVNMAFPQLYDSYDIPTFEYRSFRVSGDDLMSWSKQGDDSNTSIDLGGDYSYISQSPEFSLGYGGEFSYDSETIGENDPTGGWNLGVPFEVNKYFGDSHGIFGFADGNLSMNGGPNWEAGNMYGHDPDDTGDLNLTVGAGYGRVISAKPVAQAAAMAGELGGNISNDAILAMAGIISKWNSGWYHQTYKDDATVQYYNDLANAAGNSGAAMQIQQIATSSVYQISDRSIGWFVRAGMWNNYMRAEGDEGKGNMAVEAGYAKPMGTDRQVSASFEYDKGMSDGAGNSMTLGLAYTMDHTYTWATSAGFEYNSSVASEDADAVNTMGLGVSTTKAILNKFSVTGSFNYQKVGEADPGMGLNVRFSYWVF